MDGAYKAGAYIKNSKYIGAQQRVIIFQFLYEGVTVSAKLALVRPKLASPYDSYINRWVVRLSLNNEEFLDEINEGTYADDLRELIGLAPKAGVLDKRELRRALKMLLHELDKQNMKPTVAAKNASTLGELIGLNECEVEILLFSAISRGHHIFSALMGNHPIEGLDGLISLLSCSLNIKESEIRKSIRPDGTLLASQVLRIEYDDMGHGVELVLGSGLRVALFSPAENADALMDSFLDRCSPPALAGDAFNHIQEDSDLLVAYLSKVYQSSTTGVNVLIYGPPGTGKTEYVRWLASKLKRQLFQVRATDSQGDPVSGADRLAFFQLSQRFLKNSQAMILFDEIEDAFPSGMEKRSGLFQRRGAAGKMYINRLLETNPVPTIWVSNSIYHIDNAYLRRFDFSLEMAVPPTNIRREILSKYLHQHRISQKLINTLARQEQLTPAQIEKGAKVLGLIGSRGKAGDAHLRRVIENSMALLNQEWNDTFTSLDEFNVSVR